MPEYAIILLVALGAAFFLHHQYQLKLFKSRRHMLISYAAILSFGIVWDHLAIARGHWSFGKQFLLGPHIGLMPIEEYAFGIVLPYLGLVIYKLVEKKIN